MPSLHDQSELRRAILSPLVFYNGFHYPMTAWEIWRRMYICHPERSEGSRPKAALKNASLDPSSRQGGIQDDRKEKQDKISIAEIIECLDKDEWMKEKVIQHHGYYMLRGNEEHAHIRHEHGKITHRKYKKVRWFLKLLACLPYVRFIAICNSLPYENSRDHSDIDFFIVAEKDHVHFARMVAGFFAALFGIRPKGEHGDPMNKDTICLSFFVDTFSLGLKNFRLGNHDVYFHYWFLELFPVYDAGGYWKKIQEANSWIYEFLPNYKAQSFSNISLQQKRIERALKSFFELLLRHILKKPLKDMLLSWEHKRFSPSLRLMANCDTRVVITPHILKLHPNDQRSVYYKRFEEHLEKIQN